MSFRPVTLFAGTVPVTVPGHVYVVKRGITVLDYANPDMTPVDPTAVAFTYDRTIAYSDWGPLANFIQHDRDFADGLTGYENVSGATALNPSGTFAVSGASLYRVPAADPIAPWTAVELTVEGRTGETGPALVTPAGAYLSATYDGSFVRITENGTVLGAAAVSGISTPFIITLVQTGSSNSRNTTHCIINGVRRLSRYGTLDYRLSSVWPAYRPGIRNVSGDTAVSRLCSGVAGGIGIYNGHQVAYEDGSPYVLEDGRFVWTGDLSNFADYFNSHSVTFLLDLVNNTIEVVGVFFYERMSVGLNAASAMNWHGLNDPRARYLFAEEKFTMNWPKADDLTGNQLGDGSDLFVELDTIFGTQIWGEADIAALNFGGRMVYDVNRMKIGGTWYAGGGQFNDDGLGGILLTPWFGSGPNRNTFTTELFVDTVSPVENPNYWPLRGSNYAYLHHGAYSILLRLDGTPVGNFPLPAGSVANSNCLEMVLDQRNGETQFILVRSDNTNVEGAYSHGALHVITTPTFTVGYERNRYLAPVTP